MKESIEVENGKSSKIYQAELQSSPSSENSTSMFALSKPPGFKLEISMDDTYFTVMLRETETWREKRYRLYWR